MCKFQALLLSCRASVIRRLFPHDEVGDRLQQALLAGFVASLSASTACLNPVCAAQVASLRGVRGPARAHFVLACGEHECIVTGELPGSLSLRGSLSEEVSCVACSLSPAGRMPPQNALHFC